jgi:predicted amidohydrolase YtcJ
MAIGSDCPVVSQDPFLEIYRAVTRLHNDGEPLGGWTPSEKLSMYEVLRSYTYGSAYSAGREDQLGTLEEGKLADIIIMDQNLFNIPSEKIRKTKVLLTMMDGDIIHQAM